MERGIRPARMWKPYSAAALLICTLLAAHGTGAGEAGDQSKPVVRSETFDNDNKTLEGNSGSVLAVAFSPDGKVLASSSRDKTVKLWDPQTGRVQRTLTDHTGDVYDVEFSPRGDLLASGGGDKVIKLWDPRTGKVIRTLEGHGDIVRSVAFSPDQKTLSSGSVDLTVRLWDVPTGELKRTLKGHTERVMSVVYSPDGKTLASASSDRTVRLWDVRSGEAKALMAGHGGGVEAVAFSPDGKLLASSSQDGTVRLWDVETGATRHVLNGHVGEVDSVTFSPDGKTVVSGCKDRSIKLWVARTGQLRRSLTGHTGRVESLAFSPDGHTLASGGGGGDTSIRLWDMTGSEDQEHLQVGRQADGRIVVPTNQILTPAGKQVEFAGRPVDLALADLGRTLVVKNLKDLVFIDLASGNVEQTLASPAGFSVVGLLASGGRVYATDVKDRVRVAARGEGGKHEWADSVELKQPRVGGAAHPAGIARHSDKVLWVACTRGNAVQLVNIAESAVEQEVGVGVAPYAVLETRPGRCYVTNWGGEPPKEGDLRANSSGSPTQVDARGIASRGTVSVLDLTDGAWRQVKTIRVGLHASGMAVSHDGRFVYVANANSDTVSVISTETDLVVETIPCRPEGRLPFGSGCNALALSPGGETLYVANGTNNCVAVVRLGTGSSGAEGPLPRESRLAGLIPTAWYPGAVLVSSDGKALFVANVKGLGSLSGRKAGDKAPRAEEKGKNSHDHLGSVSIIDVPDDAQLAQYTEAVNANNRLAYSLAGLEKPRPDVGPVPVPARHGEPSVIKHVIYVIKENRTYDQVFGDMKEGNGDPKLVMYGEDVTPNHHKLAHEFTLFDNFYCSGVLSADGHQWVNEAYVTDYLEKAFGGFTRSYPYEGSDPLAFASSGFLWDNALARKKTFRNFGEFVKSTPPRGTTWADMYAEYQTGAGKFKVETKPNVATLEPYTHPGYPGFVMSIPDVFRAKVFVEELRKYERKGEFPDLVYLFLPCDHTSGTRPGMPTPRAMVADNDLALGRVVEAVSRSKFWKDTCLFVVEDDPQNGFDHVDAHRTVALVVSPYTKRGFVDSTCYNQTGMVKTIELVLGLPPMNQLDLSATAMRNAFQDRQDLTPYTAAPNNVPLDEMNPPLDRLKGEALHWAKASLELALDEADLADEDVFNRILWHSAHGDGTPYPQAFAGLRSNSRRTIESP